MDEDLKYPIGRFNPPETIGPQELQGYIADIAGLPQRLRNAVQYLDAAQLDTPYRAGGWTLRQVVNHLADSHMNALLRFKWALTENGTHIKPYREDLWAQLGDSEKMDISASLMIVEGVHQRWAYLLKSLHSDQWKTGYFHPEKNRLIPLDEAAGSYVWHGNHHLAHITELKRRKGWN